MFLIVRYFWHQKSSFLIFSILLRFFIYFIQWRGHTRHIYKERTNSVRKMRNILIMKWKSIYYCYAKVSLKMGSRNLQTTSRQLRIPSWKFLATPCTDFKHEQTKLANCFVRTDVLFAVVYTVFGVYLIGVWRLTMHSDRCYYGNFIDVATVSRCRQSTSSFVIVWYW